LLLKRHKQGLLITRSLVFVLAILGMGSSAVMCLADVLQLVGDDCVARALQASGDGRRKLLAQAVEAYRLAHRLEPWQPHHAFKMGYAHEIAASTLTSLSIDSQAAWTSAAASYSQAVLRHPANGGLQAALAWAALQKGDLISSRGAVHAALKLAPDYPDVRYIVARWYLAQWEALSVEDQQLASGLVQRGARELPQLYVDATLQLLRNLKTVRSILPSNPNVRRLLLNKLTEQGLFADRWAEQRDHPYLRGQVPANGLHVLAQGQLVGRQEPPPESTTVGPWTEMAGGWLSSGLTAKVDLDLPPGEAVLYVPILGEPAGGVWPSLSVTLGGQGLPLPAITGPGWGISYVLLSTPGGRLPLEAIVTNGSVLSENGRFVERRVRLGPVKVSFPSASVSD
jgi:hypothetical protein